MAQHLPIAAIGLVTEPKPPRVTIDAVHAGHVLLGNDEVALLHLPALGRLFPDFRHHADVFMPHNARLWWLTPVRSDVTPANPDGLNLHDPVFGRDLGDVVLSQLE